MKMARIRKIIEVKVFPSQFGDGSRIGKNVAPCVVVQDDRQSGSAFAFDLSYARNIHAAFGKPLKSDLAQRIVANAGLKSNAAAERGEVVGEDRGRRTQGEHHA